MTYHGSCSTPQPTCSSKLKRPSQVFYFSFFFVSSDYDDHSDDEYRLLRHNAFEQYSTNVVDSPVVPVVRPPPTTIQKLPPKSPAKSPSPRPKSPSVTVASLLRRATGRKSSSTSKSPDTSKRGVIPRLLQKKPAELPFHRTDLCSHTDLQSPRIPHARAYDSSLHAHTSGHSSPRRKPAPISPSLTSAISDVFDDDDLSTSGDIKAIISSTEAELQRLVDAFNSLEATAARRIRKQNAHRLPSSTPANINVVLGGKEWREHRLIPSPSSPIFDQKSLLSDGLSIRSGSSNKTTLSQSKSMASLPRHHPPESPLSPHFRTPSISHSISSVSSHGTSSGLLGISIASVASRSTSQLPLQKLKENAAMCSTDTIGLDPDDGGAESELVDIQRRREDLIARYSTRLDYLKAKLKGAELHEKLLRK